jgi:hypothetical protein
MATREGEYALATHENVSSAAAHANGSRLVILLG